MLQPSGGYTLNLYPIRCSLLVNGKATTHFINEDLPKIHDLMSKVTIQCVPINTKKLQKFLANGKLRKDTSPKLNSKAIKSKAEVLTHIKCLKCNRNCRHRTVLCETCGQWWQFFCEKLSDTQIQNNETNSEFSYKCNKCTEACKYKLTLPPPCRSPDSEKNCTKNTI